MLNNKIGELNIRLGCSCWRWYAGACSASLTGVKRSLIFVAVAVCSLAPALAAGGVIFARGSWSAIDRGATCEAVGRSARIAAKGKVQATAGFAFTSDRRRWGEFHARLSRAPRADASVMLTIGSRPFLLVTRDGWAWSRGPLQEQAIIAAVREASGMRIASRDAAGRRFSDPYVLDGAPTAIDAAAARCALRAAGKIG